MKNPYVNFFAALVFGFIICGVVSTTFQVTLTSPNQISKLLYQGSLMFWGAGLALAVQKLPRKKP